MTLGMDCNKVIPLLLLLGTMASACVGPSSPFGAIEIFKIKPARNQSKNPLLKDDVSIEVHPKRLNFHSVHNLKIKVKDTNNWDPKTQLSVEYNGIDVTSSAILDSKIRYIDNFHIITLQNLKIPSDKDHTIDIHYWTGSETKKTISLHAPECHPFQENSISTIEPFENNQYHIHLIQMLASRLDFNPSLFAGIIAQESGFNPKAVSWAKAIGLTQMTPLAEKHVIKEFPHFPSFPEIQDMSTLKIKTLIQREIINSSNEWRLDPYKSIQGGVVFMKYLHKYWQKPENQKLISKIEGPKAEVLSQILLASYHSGAFRVKKAVEDKPNLWLQNEKLKEAKKYIRRVSSYCYHFSNSDNFEGEF